MGKTITIYENGQVYEIDSDQIYVPTFEEKKSDTESNQETS